MGVFRVDKTKNYTVMSNYHFRDKRLSFKAKGLLSFMLSLPDDWDYSVQGLITTAKDGRDSVTSGLKELEHYGYLKREAIREKGIIKDWNYIIYEQPEQLSCKTTGNTQLEPDTENPKVDNKPDTENPDTEKPLTENPKQINTKDNKYINNNNKGYQGKKNGYQGRVYPPGYLDKLYANYNLPNDSVENYKKSNEITNLNDLIENND